MSASPPNEPVTADAGPAHETTPVPPVVHAATGWDCSDKNRDDEAAIEETIITLPRVLDNLAHLGPRRTVVYSSDLAKHWLEPHESPRFQPWLTANPSVPAAFIPQLMNLNH
jgi:hypothetical protein